MNVILLGAPGSGKGTQATRIVEKYDIKHISTGDIFRENMKNETELGKLAKSYIDQGHLVPDEVTVNMVKERISRDDCKNGVLLDGFPRTIAQAEALETFAKIDYVLDLEVEREELMIRILGRRSCSECGSSFNTRNIGDVENCPKCGAKLIRRADDNEQTVTERLHVYDAQTKPLIDFYKGKGNLHVLDGNQEPSKIFTDIEGIFND